MGLKRPKQCVGELHLTVADSLAPLSINNNNKHFSGDLQLRKTKRSSQIFREVSGQRWSRGHKARGQGQGHKKNPRPRTAFSRTEPLEAKDRNARGQGQGPRTQPQAFSEEKGL